MNEHASHTTLRCLFFPDVLVSVALVRGLKREEDYQCIYGEEIRPCAIALLKLRVES